MKTYIPNPLDTEHIVLPEALNELTEQMARNVHEVWAKGRIDEGWSYGEQRDDQQKKHPCLVAYEELPDTEREYDRNTAIETLKLILKLGFKISKYSIRSIDSAVIARHLSRVLLDNGRNSRNSSPGHYFISFLTLF